MRRSITRNGGRQPVALAFALSTGGLVASVAALGAAVADLHHASARSELTLLGGLHLTHPTVNAAGGLLLALAGVAAAVLAMAARDGWRQWWRYRRFVARIGQVEPLARDPQVSVIADVRPQAFCAGWVRPRVYISRSAVEMLSEAELDAVLAHEHHHRRGRHPLRLACGRALSRALFFLPALRALTDRCAEEAELRADRAAVQASGGRASPLASALLTFEERAPAGAAGISPERVDALLGESWRWRPPWGRLVVSLSALVGASLLVGLAGGDASARATFNVPVLSSRPCVVMTAGLLLLLLAGPLMRGRHRARRQT